MGTKSIPANDPLELAPRFRTWSHTRWLRYTYPFIRFGERVSIHYSCEIPRWSAPGIEIGDRVYIAQDVWLVVQPESTTPAPQIIIGSGCKIGRRSSIAAKNRIVLESDVLFGPDVLLRDHNHEFSDVNHPIHEQGLTQGGQIIVEKNAWFGCSAVVVCDKGELRIGRNSVIGANALVTRSVPPYSVVAGNPARVVKNFDHEKGIWVKVDH